MRKGEVSTTEEEQQKKINSDLLIHLLNGSEIISATSMASQICDAEISFICLNDKNQKPFISQDGLLRELILKNYSFYQNFSINRNFSLIIENGSDDKRLKSHIKFVEEELVNFYVSIPLINVDGRFLGSLCVMDRRPKMFRKKQLSFLENLAIHIINIFEFKEKQFDLNNSTKRLELCNKKLQMIQTANQMGIWEVDNTTGIFTWDEIIYKIFEVPKKIDANLPALLTFFPDQYRFIISSAIENAIKNDLSFDVICQFISAKGNPRWIRCVGKRLEAKVVGSFQEITKAKQRDLKFEGIFNSTLSFMGFITTDGILFEINNTALHHGALVREDVLGKYIWDCYWWQISQDTIEELKVNFKKALAGEEVVYEVKINTYNNLVITILFNLRPLFDDYGKVVYIICEGLPIEDLVHTRDHFKAVSAGTFQWNIQTGTTLYNERWAAILGYTLAELGEINNDTYIKLAHPDDLKEAGRRIQLCFDHKEDYYEMEIRLKHKKGHWVWTSVYGKVMEWTIDDKPLLMYGTHQDITLRKNKQLAISYQKEILNALYELSPIGISLIDYTTGQFLDGNNKLIEPLGYTKDELLCLNYADLTPKEYMMLNMRALCQIKAKGYYEKIEKEFIRKDGSRYPVTSHGVLVDDLNGKKLIWSFIQDISKEKEIALKVHQNAVRLKSVLQAAAQVALIATDTNGKITLFNSGAEKMLQYKSKELVGIHSPHIIHLKEEIEARRIDLSKQYKIDVKSKDVLRWESQMGGNFYKEWTYRRKDGTTLPVLLSISAVKIKNVIIGFSGVAIDISMMKKAEAEIKELLEITQEKNERLRNFAHIVSHNLRSHSIGITGILDLIETDLPELANNELVELVNKGAKNLKQTVEDLTEVIKVNLKHNIVAEVNLYNIAQKNLEILLLQIKETGIIVSNLIDKELIILGVPSYVDSIFLNFISNAIKYRNVDCKSYLKIYAKKNKSHHIINFEDNGLGIDLVKYGDKLFGMYKVFHDHTESKGLGLFITKNQVESMGGKIEVNSAVNVGTTFKVYIPL